MYRFEGNCIHLWWWAGVLFVVYGTMYISILENIENIFEFLQLLEYSISQIVEI